jgi:regulator of PEP synthase PpsR (kinase-PPPase family)
MTQHTPPVIHVISDSLGESAATIAHAAASQFSATDCIISRLPKATKLEQIQEYIDQQLATAAGEIVVFHTITDPELRQQLQEYVADKPVAAVDIIGPAIDAIAEATGTRPRGEAGLIRRTGDEYFGRIEAMEFAVDHDDGRNIEQLDQAEIVLIGASRTSKTPLTIYLATHGFKAANVPLAAGTKPPDILFELDRRRVFGLTTSPEVLAEFRHNRLNHAEEKVAGAYASAAYVQDDLDDARAIMRRIGCIVVRTDNRAIEETAQEILRYYRLTFSQ